MPIRFGHINIKTRRLDETIAFYGTVLGLTPGPAATMADQEGNAWLFDAAGAAVIHVNPPRLDAPEPDGPGALDHVAFNCPDEAEMRATLEAAGIPFRRVETRVLGVVQYNCTDPNGVRIELTFGSELLAR